MPSLPDLSIKDSLRISLKDRPFLKLANPPGLPCSVLNEELEFSDSRSDTSASEQDHLEKSPTKLEDGPLLTSFLASDMIKEKSCQSSPANAVDPDVVPFFPKARVIKPRLVSRQTLPRHIPPSLVISLPVSKPLFARKQRSAQTSLTTVLHPGNASFYASHFPPGHTLNADFVSKYGPGAEIGNGAYGFVVTAVDIASNHVVAVKFIEKRKIPTWGWYDDPELGHIPLEVALLRMIDHPGVIKFIELFEDSTYFYFVQQLHGSPWCGKQERKSNNPSKVTVLDKKDPAVLFDNMDSTATIVIDSPIHHVNLVSDILTAVPQSRSSPISSFSSSASSDTSLSNSATSESRSVKSLKPRKLRRLSYDLFECIEQHQHLSEIQTRYIFRQVVDVVHYLDGMGIYHRDIKDENVLIDDHYRVKLIDFGSAIKVEPSEGRPWFRDFRGTLAYAPPEILLGSKYHQVAPIEIWSLGLLLGFLMTGRNPFPTQDDALRGNITLHHCRIVTDEEAANLRHSQSKETVMSSLCYSLLKRCLDPDPTTRATIAEVKAHPWLFPEYLR